MDIDTEELVSSLDDATTNFKEVVVGTVDKLVTAKVNSLLGDPAQIVKLVENCPAFKNAIYDYFKDRVANEVGNRLRCGCYEGTQVDALFDKVWSESLDSAMEERISRCISTKVDNLIKARFNKAVSSLS